MAPMLPTPMISIYGHHDEIAGQDRVAHGEK